MAGLCWMAVTLAFFLSAENTLAVDQNRLAKFVNGTLAKYRTNRMFSLAVSIPEDQNQEAEDILEKVYESDPSYNVSDYYSRNEVYVGDRVVAAKVLKRSKRQTDHAEARVVDHLNDLFKPNNKNDLLLFYVYASPCVEKCTNQGKTENILERINNFKQWNSYAFVFSKIFKPRNGWSNTEEELRGALMRLGSRIGLNNIFRCDDKDVRCISCSSNGQVTHACVSDDDSQPGPSQSQPQQDNTDIGQGGSDRGVESRSKSGTQSRDRSPSGRDRSPSRKGTSPSGRGRSPSGRGRSPSGRDRSPSGRDRSPSGRGWCPSGRGWRWCCLCNVKVNIST